MTDSKTPRTDAQTFQLPEGVLYRLENQDDEQRGPNDVVPADFARQLERELNTLQARWEMCDMARMLFKRENAELRAEIVLHKKALGVADEIISRPEVAPHVYPAERYIIRDFTRAPIKESPCTT